MGNLRLDIQKVLVEGWNAQGNERKEFQADEILSLIRDEEGVSKIAGLLFDSSGSLTNNFSDRLGRVELILGHSEATSTLIGEIWRKCFEKIEKADRGKALASLASSNNNILWTMIYALPFFLPTLDISAVALSEFLYDVGERVRGDGFEGELYKALDELAFRNPTMGLALLKEVLKQKPDDLRLQIAAVLLGALRSMENDILRPEFDIIDSELKNSPDPDNRKCYHFSLVISFGRGATSIEELKNELNEMLEGGKEGITEAFRVAYKCMLGAQADLAFVKYYWQWIQNNCTPDLDNDAKYYVVDSLWRLCSQKKGTARYIDVGDANLLLLRIQPILDSNIGIWKQTEYYLVDRLNEDQDRFFSLLVELCRRNPKLIEEITLGRQHEYLLHSIARSKPDGSLARLITSKDRLSRTLGLRLFHEVGISDEFEITDLPKPDEIILELLFLELVRSPMLGDQTSRLLILLEPCYRDVAQRLQNDFRNELAFQAINYPGACLERWKAMNRPSELIQSAVSIAEKYFENIKQVSGSSANSFGFPILADAVKHGAREYSQKIHDSAREQSVFAKLLPNIQVIYGDQWATYVEGVINPPSGFQTISHSVEGPRLDEIDPEGMAIRRMQATAALSQLEKGVAASGARENRPDQDPERSTS